MKYCNLCKRNIEPKRNIGGGTVLLALFTGGIWLLAIPFYSKRCPICGNARLLVAKNASKVEELKETNKVIE